VKVLAGQRARARRRQLANAAASARLAQPAAPWPLGALALPTVQSPPPEDELDFSGAGTSIERPPGSAAGSAGKRRV
jgi:hypothetical protein